MAYLIEVTLQAEEDISRLDKTVAQNVANKIDWLAQSIEYIIPAPLKGQFKDKYKLRVGDWRVVYSPLGIPAYYYLCCQTSQRSL